MWLLAHNHKDNHFIFALIFQLFQWPNGSSTHILPCADFCSYLELEDLYRAKYSCNKWGGFKYCGFKYCDWFLMPKYSLSPLHGLFVCHHNDCSMRKCEWERSWVRGGGEGLLWVQVQINCDSCSTGLALCLKWCLMNITIKMYYWKMLVQLICPAKDWCQQQPVVTSLNFHQRGRKAKRDWKESSLALLTGKRDPFDSKGFWRLENMLCIFNPISIFCRSRKTFHGQCSLQVAEAKSF